MSLLALAVCALALAPSALAWQVTMTAEPSLKRTYHWTIAKTVDQAALTLEAGKTADVGYSVTVTPAGSTDSEWAVAGTVKMSEDPNIGIAWLRVTIQPDDLLATTTCMPETFPVELGIMGLECAYSAPLPDASGPRDAWMRAQSTAGNFRNVHTAFDFSAPTVNEEDECVNVTDSMAGVLGTVCAADGPKTFTYAKTIGPYQTAACGGQTVPNTSTFTGKDTGATGSASADVAVTVTCPPPPPPPPPPPSCKDRDDGHHWGKDDDDDDRDHRGYKDRDCDRRDHKDGRSKGYDRGAGASAGA